MEEKKYKTDEEFLESAENKTGEELLEELMVNATKFSKALQRMKAIVHSK